MIKFICLFCIIFAVTCTIVHGQECSSSLDCSLNGDCIEKKCVCDMPWSEKENCDVLSIEPMELDSGYHNSTEASWGANVVYADGKYHMFVAQFANSCPLAMWGSASTIVRAEGTSPTGPFQYKETVVGAFSHNPTIRQGFDGAYYLFMIGDGTNTNPPDCSNSSMSHSSHVNQSNSKTLMNQSGGGVVSSIHVTRSESIYGPWSPLETIVFADQSEMLCQGHTNPSPHFNPDGSVYLAFQAQPCSPEAATHWALVGLAMATSWRGPYVLVSPDPVTPHNYTAIHPFCVAGVDEDPFLWRTARGFHIVTHGMCPSGVRQAHYKYSLNGVQWFTSPLQTYHYSVQYTDGSKHAFARVERPQFYFSDRDESTGFFGAPSVLYNAVCGTGQNKSDFECVFDQLTGMTWTIARPLVGVATRAK